MTTPCEVVIYSDNQTVASQIAKEILINTKKLESKYNYYDINSIVSKINSRELQILDLQTKELLQKAKLFYTQTDTIFDITLATLKPALKLDTLTAVENYRAKFKEYVGCEHFKINKNKIIFNNPYTMIDLGGMVKEYAVDEAIKILKKRKIQNALINFGGDLYALGSKPQGEPFKIGIKNPIKSTENLLFIELSDAALTTSAHYERSTTIQNNRFSHILSKTDNNQHILSATVISPSTLYSGIFSTALMIDNTINVPYKNIKITNDLKIVEESK